MSRAFKTIVVVGILICIMAGIWYITSTSKKSNDDTEKEIIIPMGSSANKISEILKENGLIKSKLAFKVYVKLNGVSNFQAGTYYLKESMSLKEIIDILQTGKMDNPNQVKITYIEGKNFRWLAKEIAKVTNNTESDVYNLVEDKEYLSKVIDNYWFITDDILNENIYYPLEGYLFPDTYALENKDTTVETIFKKMLDRMEEILNKYKNEIENNSKYRYSWHEILTIASIVETESKKEEDRPDVASVINNRLKANMAIQSDVTTYYAIKVDMNERDLYKSEINRSNPYNTRGPGMEGKLPIGPIASVSKTSIEAAINPNTTDYLFFVADKTGKLYFTKTVEEHDNVINTLKGQGLWYEYDK